MTGCEGLITLHYVPVSKLTGRVYSYGRLRKLVPAARWLCKRHISNRPQCYRVSVSSGEPSEDVEEYYFGTRCCWGRFLTLQRVPIPSNNRTKRIRWESGELVREARRLCRRCTCNRPRCCRVPTSPGEYEKNRKGYDVGDRYLRRDPESLICAGSPTRTWRRKKGWQQQWTE